MADLEKLVIDHARWSIVKRKLKRQQDKVGVCNRKVQGGGWLNAALDRNCIERTYKEVGALNESGEETTFEELWLENIESGEVCDVCRRVRDLKRARNKASRRLGLVRSAITRAGETLIKKRDDVGGVDGTS